MARRGFYSQASHSVIVDGFALEDFAEGDDVINFEVQGDGVTGTQGLDANGISVASKRIAVLTVRLKPTSPSIARMQELARDPAEGNGRLVDAVLRTGVDDVVRFEQGIAETQGFTTGGTTMTPRTFRMVFKNYEEAE